MYAAKHTQAIANLHVVLESLTFKGGCEWNEQVSKFLPIVDEPDGQDHVHSNQNKVTKNFQTFS